MYQYRDECLFCSDEVPHRRFIISKYGNRCTCVCTKASIHHFAGCENIGVDVLIDNDSVRISSLGMMITQLDESFNTIMRKVYHNFKNYFIDESLLEHLANALDVIVAKLNYVFKQEYTLPMLNNVNSESRYIYDKTGEITIINDTPVLRIDSIYVLIVGVDLDKWIDKKVPLTAIGFEDELVRNYNNAVLATPKSARYTLSN